MIVRLDYNYIECCGDINYKYLAFFRIICFYPWHDLHEYIFYILYLSWFSTVFGMDESHCILFFKTAIDGAPASHGRLFQELFLDL